MNGRGKYEQLALECENHLEAANRDLFRALTCGYTIEDFPDRFIHNSEIIKVIN